MDHTLHTYNHIRTYDPETGGYSNVPLRPGVELVALPIAAIAAAWLRWGEEAITIARTSGIGPLLPLLGAAAPFGVIGYLEGFWSNPQDLLGIHPQVGVQRWTGTALVAGVGYLGMLLFPRLTASMAGAFAGPALFAIAGYGLFPSFLRAASGDRHRITGAEERLADILSVAFALGALVVATAAILMMLRSKRLPQRPLSYAVWMGALMLCLAASGTFNGSYPGR